MYLKPDHFKLPVGYYPQKLEGLSDKLQYAGLSLISLIAQLSQDFQRMYPKDKEIQKGWIGILMGKLKVLGCRGEWSRLKKSLVNLDVIEVNESYEVGVKTQKYKLSETMLNQKWEFVREDNFYPEYKIGRFKSPNRRLYKEFVSLSKKEKESAKEIYAISESLNKLTFDKSLMADDVLHRAETIYEKAQQSKYPRERNKTLEDCISLEWEYIDRLSNTSAITISDTNGRMFYPLTNWPKIYRKHLYYGENKEKLYSVDCVTFQPVLLSALFHPDQKEQRDDYLNFVTNYDLYTVAAERAGITREEAKPLVIACLYCNEYSENTFMMKILRELFSELMDNLSLLRKGGAHRQIPIAMQRLESDIIIQGALKEFCAMYPGEFILPIHDCFLVKEEYIEVVSFLIEKNSILKAGVAPNLKVENVSL